MSSVVVHEEMVRARDGVGLSTEITLLDDGVPRPVLLARTPYSKAGSRVSDDPVGLARDGWVHVVQDVRGRFDSEGTFAPFEQEKDDGADTIAWLARQPWCDGTVVGWGASYLGTTQLLAAAARPPALKAVSPVVTGGRFDEGWTTQGGVVATGFVLSWAANLAASDPRATARRRERAVAMVVDTDRLYRTPLAAHPLRKLFAPLDRWLDPGYRWPDALGALRRRSLPGFHVAGWFDVFADASLSAYASMVEGGAPQRLVVGPWTHAALYQDATPEEQFGLSGNGIFADVRGQALRFLRAAAGGSAADLDTGVRAFVTGANGWWDLPSWPPRARPTTLFLHADGALAPEPGPEAVQRLEHDPADPVPTRGGRVLQPVIPFAGPCDQRVVEQRPDVLVHTAPPLRSSLTVAGPVTAAIQLRSTAPTADVAVKLVDVHPDGRAMGVVDGIRRVSTVAGRAVRAEVAVGSIAHTFRAGHCVRVEVAASNAPRFEVNPVAAQHTILCGGRRPSSVTLPVVDR